jgi:hypothetical protein
MNREDAGRRSECFAVDREPVFVAVELHQNLQAKWRDSGYADEAGEDRQRAHDGLKAMAPKTMAGFAAKFRTLERECMSAEGALWILRQLREDFDGVYVDTSCPLGMLAQFQDSVANFPEDVWDGHERCEVDTELVWEIAQRLPPPKTEAGQGMLDTFLDCFTEEADAEARRRVELMLDEKAWSADQREQKARRDRELDEAVAAQEAKEKAVA